MSASASLSVPTYLCKEICNFLQDEVSVLDLPEYHDGVLGAVEGEQDTLVIQSEGERITI